MKLSRPDGSCASTPAAPSFQCTSPPKSDHFVRKTSSQGLLNSWSQSMSLSAYAFHTDIRYECPGTSGVSKTSADVEPSSQPCTRKRTMVSTSSNGDAQTISGACSAATSATAPRGRDNDVRPLCNAATKKRPRRLSAARRTIRCELRIRWGLAVQGTVQPVGSFTTQHWGVRVYEAYEVK